MTTKVSDRGLLGPGDAPEKADQGGLLHLLPVEHCDVFYQLCWDDLPAEAGKL